MKLCIMNKLLKGHGILMRITDTKYQRPARERRTASDNSGNGHGTGADQ